MTLKREVCNKIQSTLFVALTELLEKTLPELDSKQFAITAIEIYSMFGATLIQNMIVDDIKEWHKVAENVCKATKAYLEDIINGDVHKIEIKTIKVNDEETKIHVH